MTNPMNPTTSTASTPLSSPDIAGGGASNEQQSRFADAHKKPMKIFGVDARAFATVAGLTLFFVLAMVGVLIAIRQRTQPGPAAPTAPSSRPAADVGATLVCSQNFVVDVRCKDITASTTSPKVGDQVTFTCAPVANVNRYEFRVVTRPASGGVAITHLDPSAAGSNVSAPYTVTNADLTGGQCRTCWGSDPDQCLAWEWLKDGESVSEFVGRAKCLEVVTGSLIVSTPSPEPSLSPTPTPLVTPSPTPTPSTTIYSCNSPCTTTAQCLTGNANHICSGGYCRLQSNVSSTTCTPAVVVTPKPTPSPTIGCNDTCSTNADCFNADHICYSGQCRLESNVTSTTCSQSTTTTTVPTTTSQPTLPEELPQTGAFDDLGKWIIAGIGAVGIGALLLLML